MKVPRYYTLPAPTSLELREIKKLIHHFWNFHKNHFNDFDGTKRCAWILSQGMYIYSITEPAKELKRHWRSSSGRRWLNAIIAYVSESMRSWRGTERILQWEKSRPSSSGSNPILEVWAEYDMGFTSYVYWSYFIIKNSQLNQSPFII